MPEEGRRLQQISERLEAAALELGDGDLDSEQATRLANECAELASEAVAELDRLARGAPGEVVPGQEELL